MPPLTRIDACEIRDLFTSVSAPLRPGPSTHCKINTCWTNENIFFSIQNPPKPSNFIPNTNKSPRNGLWSPVWSTSPSQAALPSFSLAHSALPRGPLKSWACWGAAPALGFDPLSPASRKPLFADLSPAFSLMFVRCLLKTQGIGAFPDHVTQNNIVPTTLFPCPLANVFFFLSLRYTMILHIVYLLVYCFCLPTPPPHPTLLVCKPRVRNNLVWLVTTVF